MGKINEIIESGIAPGAVCGNRPFDPDSVFHKAPRGLRELETQPRFKHGPNYSARDISKHFGMPTDFIKNTWAKPAPKAAALLIGLLLLVMPAKAGYITAGETLTDGQTVHASDLMNLVQNAVIGSGFIYSQPINNTPIQSDYILEYSPTLGGLYKATLLNAFLANPQSITLLPSGTPIYTNADLFSFYSVANTNLESINASNLAAFFSTYANPSLFPFAYTNIGTGTNTYFLPVWTGPFSGPNTNNQPESIWWGTNGVPYQQSLSNLESDSAQDMGSNYLIRWETDFAFTPWKLYGTNTTSPFTNAFGYTTNFPITSAYQTNGLGSNLLTMTSTDSIPILANNQGTNTSVTLGGLYSYFTNLNALPNYTQARIQFSGFPLAMYVSNTEVTATSLFCTSNAASLTPFVGGTPYAVDFLTNGATALFAGVQTNTLYYVVAQATNTSWFRVYTNLVNATAQTNYQAVNVTSGATLSQMLYLTNFTSFNADVTQNGNNMAQRTAIYDVWFRSPAPSALYYVTGNALPPVANSVFTCLPALAYDDVITTNEVRISTYYNSGNGAIQSGLVHILISPQ